MQRLYPPPALEIEREDVYRDLLFPEPPSDRPYMLLNFVATLDGQTTLGQGGAAGIGSATDHRLMARLRVAADALLHGAGTVRKDNFPPSVPVDLEPERLARGLAAQPFGAVVTARGDIGPDNRYFARPGSLVFTADQQVERLRALFGDRAGIVGCGDGRVELAAALRAMRRDYGARVVLCEGGPRLTHDLVAAGLLDEIFLTLAPRLASDGSALRLLDGPAFRVDALPQAELRHILHAESELFLRYRLTPTPVPLGADAQ